MNNSIIKVIAVHIVLLVMLPGVTEAAKAKVYGSGQTVNHPDGSKQICPDDFRKVCAKIPVQINIGESYEVEILDENEEIIDVQTLVVDDIVGSPDTEGNYNGIQLFWTEPEE